MIGCINFRGKRVDSKRQGTIIAVDDIGTQPAFGFLGCKPLTRTGLWPVFPESMSKSEPTPATHSQTKELVVQNKMGIHARPAAMIVRITNKFKAEVFVEKDEEQVNGKSIMGLMMLAAGYGSKLTVTAEGQDAEQAMAQIAALIESGFSENR